MSNLQQTSKSETITASLARLCALGKTGKPFCRAKSVDLLIALLQNPSLVRGANYASNHFRASNQPYQNQVKPNQTRPDEIKLTNQTK